MLVDPGIQQEVAVALGNQVVAQGNRVVALGNQVVAQGNQLAPVAHNRVVAPGNQLGVGVAQGNQHVAVGEHNPAITSQSINKPELCINELYLSLTCGAPYPGACPYPWYAIETHTTQPRSLKH